jgi:hypothetical protein
MKDESTPESNAAERMAFSGEYMVPTEFARQLERERNEARAEVDRLREKLDLVPISWDT